MARKIVVFSTKTNTSQTLMSTSSTWGELRAEIPSLLNEDMVATIVETRNQLVSMEAILPEGEFKLVLTPAKTKSGSESIDVASVIACLKEKFDEAFEDILNEIEEGEHSSTSHLSSSDLSLAAEAAKIKRELGL
jgi:hypothetical protein